MDWLSDYGFWGLFFGSFLAATVVPFSSEALVLGVLTAGGNVITTVAVASLGNWLGGLTSYWVGRAGNWQLIERWFHISREKLEKQQSKIDRWRSLLALMTWLPFVGDIFAVGLGFYKINVVFVPGACANAFRYAVTQKQKLHFSSPITNLFSPA